MITLLPPFIEHGILPPTPDSSPYVCTRDEVERHFVTDFADVPWRRTLFDGWDLLHRSVAQLVPSARWWLWGSLTTAIPEPLFGERAVVSAVLHVDVGDLPEVAAELGLLVSSVHSSLHLHAVDTHLIIQGLPSTRGELLVWRRRARRAVVDLESREMIPAGFIEVHP